jgi:hypothetical protein
MANLQHTLRADRDWVWESFRDADRVSDRKLRLLACACCRSVWKWLGRMEHRAVELAERYADGLADDEERLSLADEAWFDWSRVYGRGMRTILLLLSDHVGPRDCFDLCRTVLAVRGPRAREEIVATLREEILGPAPPYRAELDPGVLVWRGGVVGSLAHFIDAEGQYDALPVLADALEEAGCTDEEILSHCRRRGLPHTRGCWVVDFVLGK